MSSSSSIFFLLRKQTNPSSHHLLSLLTHSRSMGGGPRTFKGGLSKWQHKRMHEKLAMEKEHKLLNHEKQLYQSRLRSEIRANSSPSSSSGGPTTIGPMTSKDHIKALADRFMKAGAEDLWNQDDGPEKTATRYLRAPPADMRRIGRREYSTWRSGDDDEDDEEEGFGMRRRRGRSSGALGEHDVKVERRRVMKEGDWKERIREIREEVREEVRWKGEGVGGARRGEEVRVQGSVLTEKR